jgi:hypothetical protein
MCVALECAWPSSSRSPPWVGRRTVTGIVDDDSVVIDGIEGNSLSVPASAIRRLSINRNPYSAQFRGPGKARVEVGTDHGSRRLIHGNASMFVRNSALGARNAFAVTTPPLDRRLWESTLGGPLPGKGFSFFVTGNRLINNGTAIVNALQVGGRCSRTCRRRRAGPTYLPVSIGAGRNGTS